MVTLERYESAKRELERLKDEQERRRGGEQMMLRRLKEEYSLKSLEAAERDVVKNEKLAAELEEEINDKLDEVEGMK